MSVSILVLMDSRVKTSIAETNPVQILDNLASLPSPDIHSYVNTNEGKAMVVAQATIEKANPKILKKLGINSAADAVPLVSSLNKLIKPLERHRLRY